MKNIFEKKTDDHEYMIILIYGILRCLVFLLVLTLRIKKYEKSLMHDLAMTLNNKGHVVSPRHWLRKLK